MAHEQILAVLQSAGEDWVSGEEISRQLGISRTAVWKQIEALRAAGYTLEAQTRLGYRLTSSPDRVTATEILAGLATLHFGREVEHREQVGSTNDLAKQLAREGAREGLVVVAEQQVAGKGRLGRSWSTPRGSAIAMTLVLRPTMPPHQAPRVTLVAAVAVAEAVRAITGLPVGIKWPNDVQLEDRKFCGILTEMEADMDRIDFVVCGMGLNVNMEREAFAPEYRNTATSLRAEAGRTFPRAPLIQAILARFESAYDQLAGGRFEAVLDRWRSLSITLGRPVRVSSATGAPTLVGTAEDVDADGALLVRTEDGALHRVLAGEVSLRQSATS